MAKEDRGVSGAPPSAIRLDFARRLQNAMNDKGWTQAELARRVAPLLKESRIGRDNISKYVRGKVLPLPPALEAMAKVLGMESKDLLPSRGTQATAEEHRRSMCTATSARTECGCGVIIKRVDRPIALQILGLLKGKDHA